MIEAYIGKMRQGKTLAMTERVIKELNKGKVVYVNYKVNWNPEAPMSRSRYFLHRLGWKKKRYPYTNLRAFKNWEDVSNIANCVVALDEGWQYFDSYQKLPMEKRMRLYQSGKWELDFLYTVQRYMMADINLRWNTQWFHEARKYDFPSKSWPFIVFHTYDLEEDDEGAKIARKGIKPDGSIVDLAVHRRIMWPWTARKLFSLYDTKEDIYATDELRSQLAKKVDARGTSSGPYYDSTPTYWDVLRSLTSRYAYRRPTRSKKGRKVAQRSPVVARVPHRVRVDGVRLVDN